jgi:hypothetical protein
VSPQPKTKGKPGNSSPASSRFFYPRPPLGDFTKVDAIQKQSPPTSVGGPAAVYLGASPRRIGLGSPPRARPLGGSIPH